MFWLSSIEHDLQDSGCLGLDNEIAAGMGRYGTVSKMAEVAQTQHTEQKALTIDEKLKYESTKMLAELGRASFLVSIVNAVIVYLVFRGLNAQWLMTGWLAAVVLVSLIRTFMVSRFLQMDENDPRHSRWLATYLIAVYFTGACWGILPLLPMFDATSWSQAFIIFTVSGMSAGALVSLYPLRKAAIPYLILVVAPLITVLAQSPQAETLAMALLASLYLLLLVRSAYILNAAANKTLRLELQNEELFEFLVATRDPDMDKLDHSPDSTGS
jgi:hypothetical protein